MPESGTLRKRLSEREGARNSDLPGRMTPLDRGEVDTKMTGVHGSNPQGGGGDAPYDYYGDAPAVTKMESGFHQANPGQKCRMKGVPQAQGKDPSMTGETVALQTQTRRTHVKGHSGSGPNYGGMRKKSAMMK